MRSALTGSLLSSMILATVALICFSASVAHGGGTPSPLVSNGSPLVGSATNASGCGGGEKTLKPDSFSVPSGRASFDARVSVVACGNSSGLEERVITLGVYDYSVVPATTGKFHINAHWHLAFQVNVSSNATSYASVDHYSLVVVTLGISVTDLSSGKSTGAAWTFYRGNTSNPIVGFVGGWTPDGIGLHLKANNKYNVTAYVKFEIESYLSASVPRGLSQLVWVTTFKGTHLQSISVK